MTEKEKLEILEHIKKLINIDLIPFRIKSREKRRYIHIETYQIEDNKLLQIERVACQYKKFRIEPNGYRDIALIKI